MLVEQKRTQFACLQDINVGILVFLPSGDAEVKNEAVDNSSTDTSSPFRVSSRMSINSPATGDHPLLRIIKSNLTLSGPKPGSQWVRFESLCDGVGKFVSATFDDGEEAPIVIEDLGIKDDIKKILIVGSNAMHQW